MIMAGTDFYARPTVFPPPTLQNLHFVQLKRVGSIFMKTEAWTLLSISLPRKGEEDFGMMRNSCENSTGSQIAA